MTVSEKVGWGLRWGLIFGCGFAVYTASIYIASGPQLLEPYDSTIYELVAFYIGTGGVIGAGIGLLRPLTKWTLGAAAVGFVAAVGLAVAVIVLEEGLTPWTLADTRKALTLGLVWGPPGGVIIRTLFNHDKSEHG